MRKCWRWHCPHDFSWRIQSWGTYSCSIFFTCLSLNLLQSLVEWDTPCRVELCVTPTGSPLACYCTDHIDNLPSVLVSMNRTASSKMFSFCSLWLSFSYKTSRSSLIKFNSIHHLITPSFTFSYHFWFLLCFFLKCCFLILLLTATKSLPLSVLFFAFLPVVLAHYCHSCVVACLTNFTGHPLVYSLLWENKYPILPTFPPWISGIMIFLFFKLFFYLGE